MLKATHRRTEISRQLKKSALSTQTRGNVLVDCFRKHKHYSVQGWSSALLSCHACLLPLSHKFLRDRSLQHFHNNQFSSQGYRNMKIKFRNSQAFVSSALLLTFWRYRTFDTRKATVGSYVSFAYLEALVSPKRVAKDKTEDEVCISIVAVT